MARISATVETLAVIATFATALTGCGTDPAYEQDAGPRGQEPARVAPAPEPSGGSDHITRGALAITGEPRTGGHAPASFANETSSASSVTPAGRGSGDESERVEPAKDPHAAYLEAERLYAEGDRAGAIPLLRASIAAREDFVHAHHLLGLCLRKTGDLEGAETALARALELSPSHLRARSNLARVMIDRERPRDALVTLGAVSLEGAGADAWNVRGRARLALGELAAAESDFVESAGRDPENPYALNNLGYVRIQRGAYGDALDPLVRASGIEGAPAYVFNNLGIALERTGELARAGTAFDEAVARGHVLAARSRDRVAARLAQAQPLPEERAPESGDTAADSAARIEGGAEHATENDDVEPLAARPEGPSGALAP